VKAGKDILNETEKTSFRTNALKRVICQKKLSIFCGIWNKFNRVWDTQSVESWAYLVAYGEIKQLMVFLQEYNFQDESCGKYKRMRKTIATIILSISEARRKTKDDAHFVEEFISSIVSDGQRHLHFYKGSN
jgi:hypothetical protein